MWAYIARRILLTVPTVIGIVMITMFLFHGVVKDPARAYVGKFATPQALEAARARMGIDKPKWFDAGAFTFCAVSLVELGKFALVHGARIAHG